MKTNRYIRLLLAVMLLSASAISHGQVLQNLKQNYRNMLLAGQAQGSDTLLADLVKVPQEQMVADQMVQELMNRYPIDTCRVEKYLLLIQDDGSFADIDYNDQKRSGWKPKLHAERTLELCRLYQTPSTHYYHHAPTARHIHQLLNFWFQRKPVCQNWWQNQIGIPKTLGQAFLLMEDELTPAEKEQAVEVMNQAKFGMTGQNKVWLAANVMIRGLLTNDEATVVAARDTIFSEITLDGAEGIQPDWSYQLHGPQQQFGNYGLAFLSGMAFFCHLFDGTPWQMSEAQRNILTQLVDKGFRWTIWHRQMDISSLGRQLFHNASLHKGYGVAFAAQDLGMSGFPLTGNPLVGHRHFPYSDYTIHRTPRWMASLKMSSQRTIGTEHVNEDNVLGYYLGDGATYYYIDSNDYMDALPIWDWRKIPGTTAYESTSPPVQSRHNPRNDSQQVGGIGDGEYGMSAMNYRRNGIHAKKAWVFTPKMVICMGAGISSDSSLAVTTSIDQRMAHGTLEKVTTGRYYHNGIGYILLQESDVHAFCGERSGSWSDNMKIYEPETVTGQLMQLYINHGHRPQGGSYLYAVLPDATREEVADFNVSKQIRIVENNDTMQVITGKAVGNRYWGVFYHTTSARIDGRLLQLPSPGIYCFEKAGKGFRIVEGEGFGAHHN